MKKIKITNEGVISNGNSMLKILLCVVFFEIKKHKSYFIFISLVLFLIYCIVESFSTLNELRIFSVTIIVFLVGFWFFIKWLINKKPKEGRRVR